MRQKFWQNSKCKGCQKLSHECELDRVWGRGEGSKGGGSKLESKFKKDELRKKEVEEEEGVRSRSEQIGM